MGIQPVKKVNVGEQVFRQLKEMILKGEWPAEKKIPSENELAEMLHVSRITVRQALQKLNALGLIETRPGEGSFVKQPDAGDNMNALIPVMYLGNQSPKEVFEFRQIIETESVRLAAKRVSRKDIQALRDTLQEMIWCRDHSDPKGFSESDLQFHLQIAQITKNSLIIRINSILQDVLGRSMDEVISKMGCENGIYYHEQIIKAVEAHDEEKAVQLMKEHIEKNYKFF